MPKPDMSVAVNVQISGTIDNSGALHATAAYSQGTTIPASSNVVDAGGDINLNNMNDSNNNYSNQTDITFMLSGTVTDQQGNSYAVEFPAPVSSAINIQQKGGGGNGQMTPSLNSGTQLFVDDADQDGQDYTYCLTIQADTISANGEPTCSLDPQIVNR